jgi:hypothetical protein
MLNAGRGNPIARDLPAESFQKKIKCAGLPAHLKEHPRSGLQIKL